MGTGKPAILITSLGVIIHSLLKLSDSLKEKMEAGRDLGKKKKERGEGRKEEERKERILIRANKNRKDFTCKGATS